MVVCFHYLEPLVGCRQQMLMVYQWVVPSVAFGDLVGGEDLMPEPATEGVVVVVVAPPARGVLCSVVV